MSRAAWWGFEWVSGVGEQLYEWGAQIITAPVFSHGLDNSR